MSSGVRSHMVDAVHIHNLSKDFPVDDRDMRVLFDINATIRMGELTMLVGPSGCGKTTLISILSGILSPSEGSVDLFGTRITDLDDTDKVMFRRQNIGFIFQQYNLLPALNAYENAALPLAAAGIDKQTAADMSRNLLTMIGMGEQVYKYPRQLSGGQQQRVAIARALVHNPRLVVCDEPTAALDSRSGQQVMDILRATANDHSRAVIVVTHDSRIYRYADRILEMADGRIVGDYTAHEFINKKGA